MVSQYVLPLLMGLAILSCCTYTKSHSPLIDNGVYFYKRLAAKLGT